MSRELSDQPVTVSARRSGQSALVWLVLSAGVVGLDQLSKALVTAHLSLGQSVTLLPVLQIMRLQNPGAAFSMFANAGGWQRWMFSLLGVLVSAALVLWLRRISRREALLAAGLALIVGGALGNVIDRLRTGEVTDFIAVHWSVHYFPPFNVADSAITIGAGLLLLEAWRSSRNAPAGPSNR